MKRLAILLFIVFSWINCYSQRGERKNWVQVKNEYTARWRFGVGIHLGEPAGAHIQVYRLSKICTGNFSITKKMSLNASVSKEGYLIPSLLEKKIDGWQPGGTRIGLDYKFFIPIILNPYVGIGAETGTRHINDKTKFSTDFIGRVGLEQGILGVKLSNTSSLNVTLFLDAKIHYSVDPKATFFLPNVGLRFHFL